MTKVQIYLNVSVCPTIAIFFLAHMTSEVPEGHILSPIYLKNNFFLDSFFVLNLISLKLYMNANIMKTQIFHEIKYDLKGQYIRHFL